MEITIPNNIGQHGNEPVKISIIFPTTVYFLSGVRDFTLQIVKNLTGFSDQWAFRFQSVVDELCNNAIEHGSAPGENILLSLISVREKSFEVIIEDTGTGPNPINARELQRIFIKKQNQDPTKAFAIRGRGLSHIVAPLSDEIYFTDLKNGGIRVRVIKFFKNTKEENEESTIEKTMTI